MKSFLCALSFAIPSLIFSGENEDRVDAFLKSYFPKEEAAIKSFHRGHHSARNYLIEAAGEKYVLRLLPLSSTEEEIQRELYMIQEASELGISPKVFAISDRAVLMEYIDVKTLTPQVAALHAKEAGEALSKAHSIQKNPTATPQYLDAAEFRYTFLQEREIFPESKVAIDIIRKESPKLSQEKANLHSGLHAQNLFWTDDGLKIIDWDDTVWDSPYYDLTCFAIFLALDAEAEANFLEGYFGRPPTKEEIEHYILTKRINLACISLINLKIAAQILEQEPGSLDQESPLKELSFYMGDFAEANSRMPVQFFYDVGRCALKMSQELE
jgi:Ser/Thr protein kinase RdoA (MazF antagonist)